MAETQNGEAHATCVAVRESGWRLEAFHVLQPQETLIGQPKALIKHAYVLQPRYTP